MKKLLSATVMFLLPLFCFSQSSIHWENLGPNNMSGNVNALLIDKDNPLRMYSGNEGGGLFYTDNGGLSWQPHNQFGNLAANNISCIVQAANGTIYIGTGVVNDMMVSNITNLFSGNGIFKSTDGGITFTHIVSANTSLQNTRWRFINNIAVDPSNPDKIFAATAQGLMFSTDKGDNWFATNIPDPNDNNYFAHDVVIGNDGTIYAAIRNKYHRSINGGQSFDNLTGQNGFPSGGISRVVFAVTPQDHSMVYAMVRNNNGMTEIFRSLDKGVNWEQLPMPTTNIKGEHRLSITIDPTNKNRILVGGDVLWSYSDNGNTSTGSWTLQSSGNVTMANYLPHLIFSIVFHPLNPGKLFIGSGGGIYYTGLAQDASLGFVPRNNGLKNTQFYAASASLNGNIIGSASNGNLLLEKGGSAVWPINTLSRVSGDVAVSAKYPNIAFSEGAHGSVSRSIDGGNTYNYFFDKRIDPDGNGEPAPGALFFAPITLWEHPNADSLTKGIFYLGANNGYVYLTPHAIDVSVQPRWYRFQVPSPSGAISALHTSTDGIVYVGTINGSVFRVDGVPNQDWDLIDSLAIYPLNLPPSNPTYNIHAPFGDVIITQVFDQPGRFVTSINVDRNDAQHVVVTFGTYGNQSYVFRSINAANATSVATAAFESIQNNLPQFPVFDALIPANGNGLILVGSNSGVWASNDDGCSWSLTDNGMPNVPVFTIRESFLYDDPDNSCYVIYAATYGRGVYRTTSLTPATCDVSLNIKTIRSLRNNIRLYPNPADTFLNVEWENATGKIQIDVYDLMGRKVKSIQPIPETYQLKLDVGEWQKGIYLFQIKTEKERSIVRFVIQ